MKDATDAETYDITRLCELSGMTRRNVRYYIQEGIVDQPLGESARAARYTKTHLWQLLAVASLREAGLSIEAVRQRIRPASEPLPVPAVGQPELWQRIPVAPGVEMHISPLGSRLDSAQIRQLFQVMQQAVAALTEHPHEDPLP